MKTLSDLRNENPMGKIALLRLDLNVPMQDGKITDETRIRKSLPTIKALCDMGMAVLILAHFGRPEGEVKSEFSLAPVAEYTAKLLKTEMPLLSALQRPDLSSGQVAMLENIRFHKGEEQNAPDFTAKLAEMGDVFVNDAFSAAHRAHASTAGLAHYLPAYAGLLMEEELNALHAVFAKPQPPVMAIVGGSKISTKLDLLSNLIEKTDILVLGGGMANTFLKAQGQDIGPSLCEDDMLDTARHITIKAKDMNCTLILPVDEQLHEGKIFDIGPKSVANICSAIDGVKTIIWNGPLGVFEMPPFDKGTVQVAQYVAAKTQSGALISVAGGGDTVSALNKANVTEQFTYISTAGGAFLEYMEGKVLPGVQALIDGETVKKSKTVG